jgi:acetylornithine/succinyldiaminopimelate/putrescine aminotransferase
MANKISRTYTTKSLSGGAPTAAVVTSTAATSTSPFGFSTGAQADALVATVNNLVADVAADRQLLNAVIDELQARSLL